jgi:aldehyde:ferredoxin oxidoreductase
MYGHAGRILRLDLTDRKYDAIDTHGYEAWYGGEAMGTALWWDEVSKDYMFDSRNKTGFEPDNVLILLSGPLQGTLAPSGGRTEIVGMAPAAYPRPQFSRGNLGGRFSAMMKFAGYDAIVIKGAADKPVWVNVINDRITFEKAGEDGYKLWGMDTYEAQLKIWNLVAGSRTGQWLSAGTGSTTQLPAVVLIGQAGERLARVATLQHEAGHANGQCGFGGVFGAKKLKAISILGTGSFAIASGKDLLDARKWYRSQHATQRGPMSPGQPASVSTTWDGHSYLKQAACCLGCDRACIAVQDTGGRGIAGTGTMCVETDFNNRSDRQRMIDVAKWLGYKEEITAAPATGSTWGMIEPIAWMQRYGINAYDLSTGGQAWLKSLHARGYLGNRKLGSLIYSDMDFSRAGKEDGAFAMELLRRIAYREEIGDDLAEGPVRCAKKWGVLEEDLMSGALPMIYWIGQVHWGIHVCYAYESLFGVRDINNHRNLAVLRGSSEQAVMERQAKRFAELAAPWHDPLGIDRSPDRIYSLSMARCVAWGRRHSIFYTNSAMFCDWNSPLWWDTSKPDQRGNSPEFETRFLNAITGKSLTYEQGLEIGQKTWNLQRAILTMHGRHRDEEYFPPFPPYDSYVYQPGEPYLQNNKTGSPPPATYCTWKNNAWVQDPCRFPLEKTRMDEFKTAYYALEGWDTKTGGPKRSTLEKLGLKFAADELEKRGILATE